MLDGVSLDQLRTFIAAADEGSFSAAARKLNRVQSAVSGWIASLEEQIGVVLFDRTARYPTLTPEGVLLLADARNIVAGVDTLKARAHLMKSGVEPELSVVIDVFFPTSVISAVVRAFAARFPLTPLRLFVEGLGAAFVPVLDGRCSIAICPPLPQSFPGLVSERLGDVPLVAVASKQHPLAAIKGRISRRELSKHVQLVLTDRSTLTAGQDFAVASPATWRLADLSTKHALLKDALGWGGMPMHMVAPDLAAGTLVALDVDEMPLSGYMLTMSAYHQPARPPGLAGRWFVDRLKAEWEQSSAAARAAANDDRRP